MNIEICAMGVLQVQILVVAAMTVFCVWGVKVVIETTG